MLTKIERAGLITRRSLDRNQLLLLHEFFYFFGFCDFLDLVSHLSWIFKAESKIKGMSADVKISSG